MALSRERIADELLKLLGAANPAPTVGIMLQRAILKPVLPEVEPERLGGLESVIAAEAEAGIEADALRRMAALLPRNPQVADDVAVRLRLSNKARKRLVCATTGVRVESAEALAYREGSVCAVDRLLLDRRGAEAASIAKWKMPRLPISGGKLIGRGLTEGPVVAKTLRQIEDQWVSAGFPGGDEFERIVAGALAKAVD
jgi:tRNA nucleotidyltransferase/poly(A) polymerase